MVLLFSMSFVVTSVNKLDAYKMKLPTHRYEYYFVWDKFRSICQL